MTDRISFVALDVHGGAGGAAGHSGRWPDTEVGRILDDAAHAGRPTRSASRLDERDNHSVRASNEIPYSGVVVPASAADKPVFTEEESASLEEQTNARRPGFMGAYNVWMDAGDRFLSTRQTSLVVDPPDGRVPVKASAAAVRERNIARQRDDYRAMSTWTDVSRAGFRARCCPPGTTTRIASCKQLTSW